jgi:hypothetical protein
MESFRKFRCQFSAPETNEVYFFKNLPFLGQGVKKRIMESFERDRLLYESFPLINYPKFECIKSVINHFNFAERIVFLGGFEGIVSCKKRWD